MAKDMEIKEHGEGCMCGACHGCGTTCGMWGHHHWGHMVIKIFIVLFIFWAGMQFGELKATVQNYYNGGFSSGMMGGWGGERGNVYYTSSPIQGGMMGGSWAQPSGAVNVKMMQVSTTSAPRQ